jgi:conjugal transfer pilus assembly protein TraU
MRLWWVAILATLILPVAGRADDAGKLLCPNANALSGALITDVYWDGVFPIVFAGAPLGGGTIPEGAGGTPVCFCNDPAGLPQAGFWLGMWKPARLIELVRTPGCMAALGGTRLEVVGRFRRGTGGGQDYDNGDKSYSHYHLYAFPLLTMLGLISQDSCHGDGFVDFDMMYMSELDPTWQYDELAFLTAPESALVSSLPAQTACIADAAAANVGQPLDSLWWCAGSWGGIYPLGGTHVVHRNSVQTTSLLATRALMALHRRGLEWRTMGPDVMCHAKLDPFMKKGQYRMSMFWPVAEANGYHPIGRSVLSWGMGRTIPGSGEDAVYLLWRWEDCCAGFM